MNEIYIAPLEIQHAQLLFSYLQEVELYNFIPDKKYSTIQEFEANIQRLISGSGRDQETWLNWVIFKDNELKQPIGRLQATIFLDQKIAQIGYIIFKPFWNLGYATSAVQWIEKQLPNQFLIQKFEAYIDPKNLASIKVLEKNGFKFIKQEDGDLYYLKSIS